MHKMAIYNALSFGSLGLYYWPFCSVHWMFAMKYWIISYKIAGGKKTNLANVAYYFVLLMNFAIPVFEAVEEGLDAKNFLASYQMLIWIQIFSCLV